MYGKTRIVRKLRICPYFSDNRERDHKKISGYSINYKEFARDRKSRKRNAVIFDEFIEARPGELRDSTGLPNVPPGHHRQFF